MHETPRNYSRVICRPLKVLDLLASHGAPMRAADIAAHLDIARSSADQLLKSLVFSGYLVRSPRDKTYFPSLPMSGFARWAAEQFDVLTQYRRIIDDIHEQTGEITTLTAQNDYFMQMLEARGGDRADPVLTSGARIPIAGSAIGGALLSGETERDVTRLLARASRFRPAGDIPSVDQIRAYRMKGYSWGGMQHVHDAMPKPVDLWSIAIRLPAIAAGPMVLGLAGPRARVRAREWTYVNLMRRTIRQHLA
jgi:DNA-binding IclR family transcriptional regulator